MQKPSEDFNAIETIMMQGLAFKTILEGVKIGLFDVLDKTSKSPEEVAKEMGFKLSGTKALLKFLSANELLVEEEDKFKNSPRASEFLVSTSPFFQGRSLELFNRFHSAVSEDISGLLRGETETRSIIDKNWGQEDCMDGTAQHALLGAVQDTTEFACALPEFKSMRTMCDIGGNHGEFSMRLLDLNPELTAEIADLPHVAATADKRIASRGYADRLKTLACDLRTSSLGKNKYDLVLASHILYAFIDNLKDLLAKIYESLRPDGWFVSHHLNEDGNFRPQYLGGLQFVTNLSGYKTHTMNMEKLEKALTNTGFKGIKVKQVGRNNTRLIIAGQKQTN